jgi:hypothetical protein
MNYVFNFTKFLWNLLYGDSYEVKKYIEMFPRSQTLFYRIRINHQICSSFMYSIPLGMSHSLAGIDELGAAAFSTVRRLRRLERTEKRLKAEKDIREQKEEEHRIAKLRPWWYNFSIWPEPYEYDPKWENKSSFFPRPRSWEDFQVAWKKSVIEYKSTFEGFPFLDPNTDNKSKSEDIDATLSTFINAKRKQMTKNVRNNTQFLKTEGTQLINEVKEKTGLYTAQDLKRWAGEQLQLATECTKQFIEGYREGRDQEVEKMMHTYFQGIWEESQKVLNQEEPRQIKSKRKVRRRARSFSD